MEILDSMTAKAGMIFALGFSTLFAQTGGQKIDAPRFWNDHDLSDWATPIAGLNVRPGHYSEKEYYSAPIGEYVRTYPVYFPGREPAGYWDTIRNKKPEPLIVPGSRTSSEWLTEGSRIFHELDLPYLRNYDSKLFALIRSAEECAKLGGHPQKDGTMLGLRWVPTSQGLALGQLDCAVCHSRVMPDDSIVEGAPAPGADRGSMVSIVGKFVTHDSASFLDFFSPGETAKQVNWRFWAAPWVPGDINEKVVAPDVNAPDFAGLGRGVIPRFNGSPFYLRRRHPI